VFSRVMQVLSDGMLHYLAALKLRDTPFPFPYAQANALFCLIHLALFPLVVSSKVEGVAMSAALSGFGVMMIYAVNEVARELEDPYGSAASCFGNALRLDYLNDLFLARLLVTFCGSSAPPHVTENRQDETGAASDDVSSSFHDNTPVAVDERSGYTTAADYTVGPLAGQPANSFVHPLSSSHFAAKPLLLQDMGPSEAERGRKYRRELIDYCVMLSSNTRTSPSMLTRRILA
jgi:hypothetical protein